MQATEGTSCLQQQCMPIKLSFLPSLVILYSDLSLSFFLSLHPQVLNLWYRDYSHLRLVRPCPGHAQGGVAVPPIMRGANPTSPATMRRRSRRRVRARVAFAATLVACGAALPGVHAAPPGAGPATAAQEPAAPTFADDVAPLVFRHCAPCHRPGEAGPFPLLTYEDARRRARQIAEVTSSRFMPPWKPEPGKLPFILSDCDHHRWHIRKYGPEKTLYAYKAQLH